MNATGPAESRRQKNYKKKRQRGVDIRGGVCYTNKAADENGSPAREDKRRQEHLENYTVQEKEAKAIEGSGSCREIAAQDFEDDQAKESEQRRPESGSPEGKKREGSRRD